MCTCGSLQTRETTSRATFNLHEPNPSPHPSYNVENTYPQLFLTLNIVLGGGGGNCNVVLKYGNAFRRSAQIFDNYGVCITVPRYFVQDCLNSTIVGNSAIAVFFRSDMYLGAFRDLLLRVLWLFLKELSNRLSACIVFMFPTRFESVQCSLTVTVRLWSEPGAN